MNPLLSSFQHDVRAGAITYGRGCVDGLADELDRLGAERALVVCGSNIGSNRAVMDPVEDGLGDRLAGVFSRTSPAKYVGTALEAADVIRERGADAIVGLGGGSSLDLAKFANVLHHGDRTVDDLVTEVEERGVISVPDDLLPIVAVPTTLAGADMSVGGGVQFSREAAGPLEEGVAGGHVSDRRTMPDALVYDPDLFETTPPSVLAASAMIGFDKGIEALYSRHATPVADATAIHGIRVFRPALADLADDPTGETIERAVTGAILVQYGLGEPGARKASIVHAFGHLSRYYDVQQGTVHGIVAPAVLRYVFDEVDGRRDLLADALGVDVGAHDDAGLADAIVDEVTAIRDDLGLPGGLREVEGLERDHLPDLAAFLVDDGAMINRPAGLEPTREDLERVLREAW